MLNEEKECSVMQIQILDSKGYCVKHSVFLVMDWDLDWLNVYLKKVCGKQPNVLCTCKRVKYV